MLMIVIVVVCMCMLQGLAARCTWPVDHDGPLPVGPSTEAGRTR